MPPVFPHAIDGTITDSVGTLLASTEVLVTNVTSGKFIKLTTDSAGKYRDDLGNIPDGYVEGDTISMKVTNKFGDETNTETFVVSGTSTTQDVQTAVILDLPSGTNGIVNRTTLINNAGNPYQKTNRIPVELITDGSKINTQTVENETSMLVSPGAADIEYIHLDAKDISLEEAFMLIDLSNTEKFPHEETGHIDIVFLSINVAPDATYAGDIELGFLTNVDGTNGDFNGIFEIHMDKKTAPIIGNIPLPFGGISLEESHFFGPTEANSTLFQTDVNLQGPDGNTSFPSGNGDFVMIIGRTAGEVSVGITVGYITR